MGLGRSVCLILADTDVLLDHSDVDILHASDDAEFFRELAADLSRGIHDFDGWNEGWTVVAVRDFDRIVDCVDVAPKVVIHSIRLMLCVLLVV